MKKVEIVDIEAIQELLFSFAEGNYSKRLEISSKLDERDIIIAGILMLGEELESSTVSKDYFRSIYNAISDSVIVTDPSGVITSFNDAVASTFVGEDKRLVGEPVTDLFQNEKAVETIESVISGKEMLGFFESDSSLNGVPMFHSCTISKIQSRFAVHEGFLIIAKDITQEKILEGEVLKAIIDTEEKEKRRLAYDLHDALGQELNSVKMFFDTLIAMDSKSSEYEDLIELCRDMINDCIGTARNLSYDLMPKSLEDGALFSAFEELERKNRNFLDIVIDAPEEEYKMSTEKKINIFRITQEFITNSTRHGKASKVKIKTYKDELGFHFMLSDNGVGFDTHRTANGRGLKNMSSRLKVIGATYRLSSEPNQGTRLNFSFI